MLLGLNTVKNLAISTVMINALSTRGKGAPFNSDLFWKHCLGTAVCAKFLAKALQIPEKSQETFFVAGLIHDIGKVLFVRTDPTRYEKVLQESRTYGVALTFAEVSHFGCDHTQTGGLLARKWKVDTEVVDVIEKHHDVHNHDEGLLTPVVSVGNTICKACDIGDSGNPIIEEHVQDLTEPLGLNETVLEQAEQRIPGALDKAEIFLSLHREGDHS